MSRHIAPIVAALCLAATPLLAQSPDCGGLAPSGLWIGGDPSASDPAVSAAALTAAAREVPAEGAAVALFTLSQPQTLRLEARAAAPGGDPVLALYDAAGTMIVTDDDSGGARDARAETGLAAGAYCLVVRGFMDAALVADIRVGRLEHAALTEGLRGGFFDPGGMVDGPAFVGIQPCTENTPTEALAQGSLDAALGQGGVEATNTAAAAPYYRFTLERPQSLSLRALNEAADPYIYLFDGAGSLVAENDDDESLNSRIDMAEPLAAGTYCVGMRALSNPDLPITLRVLPFDSAAAQAERVASGEAAPPLDGSWPVTRVGALPPVAVRDVEVSGTRAEWLVFEIAAPTVLLIEAVAIREGDPLILLFDASGAEIAFNDDVDGTLDSRVISRLDAGTYSLAVRQFSDAYSGTIRVITERFVRATD